MHHHVNQQTGKQRYHDHWGMKKEKKNHKVTQWKCQYKKIIYV